MLHFLGSELDLEVDEVWERYDGPRLFAGHEVSGRDMAGSRDPPTRRSAPNGYVPLSRLGRSSVSAAAGRRWATPCAIRPTVRWLW